MIWRTGTFALLLAACASSTPPDKTPAEADNPAAAALTPAEREELARQFHQDEAEDAYKWKLQTFVHPAICNEDRKGRTGDAWITIQDGKVVKAGIADGSPDNEVDLTPQLAGKAVPPIPAKYEKLFAGGEIVYFSWSCM
ncbi:hypothetical protein [Polyangium jinanense]|uniref:Lipoprotein n=1 Tax=Polyangium jinanense TaxID=2829994 RepID=A0A9X4AZZ4_9BACT|nr:hypothetical protein [Polyangium jinanense]MDC3962886.1 hypothetical protein [Polyangium jinanense]MDC3988642.1 hypothetical protein [Polyangium jinanense]